MPNFPATADVDPNETRSFELIPPGWYAAHLVDSYTRAAKSGEGEYINMTFELLNAPYANRKVWEMLNLWHSNPTTVQIANQQRIEIITAMGRPNATTTEELYGIPVMIKLTIREDRTGKYEPQNAIKGYKPYGNVPPAAAVANTPARSAPSAAAKKPWEK